MNKPKHGKKWMPAMYVAYFGILQKVAREHGYALCVHGSIVRDFDLIAVPFGEKLKSHQELLSEIRSIIGFGESSEKKFDIVGMEPHGRMCYTIECGGGGYLDISFTPTMQQAIEMIEKNEKRGKEMKELLQKCNPA